jgi:hypothetical protein
MKKPVFIMVAAALVAFCTAMWVHGARAGVADHPYSIKALVYDGARGMVLTYGSPQSGPILFKTEGECKDALAHDENVKKMQTTVTKTAHEQLGPQTMVKFVCLPVVAGESVD